MKKSTVFGLLLPLIGAPRLLTISKYQNNVYRTFVPNVHPRRLHGKKIHAPKRKVPAGTGIHLSGETTAHLLLAGSCTSVSATADR